MDHLEVLNADNTGKLTEPEFWDAHWMRFRLPYVVDTRTNYLWHTFDQLFRSVLPRKPQRLLEVGCGAAQWLVHFHKHYGYEVCGLDNSPQACEIARKNFELTQTPGQVIYGDILDESLDVGTFDIILSMGVVEHFQDPSQPLAKLARFLAPGGLLITTVPNMAGSFGVLRKMFDPEIYALHTLLTAEDLSHAYAALGLRTIKTGYFASFRIPRVSRSKPGTAKLPRSAAWFLASGLDRILTTVYRRSGRALNSRTLSAQIYAIGQKA